MCCTIQEQCLTLQSFKELPKDKYNNAYLICTLACFHEIIQIGREQICSFSPTVPSECSFHSMLLQLLLQTTSCTILFLVIVTFSPSEVVHYGYSLFSPTPLLYQKLYTVLMNYCPFLYSISLSFTFSPLSLNWRIHFLYATFQLYYHPPVPPMPLCVTSVSVQEYIPIRYSCYSQLCTTSKDPSSSIKRLYYASDLKCSRTGPGRHACHILTKQNYPSSP